MQPEDLHRVKLLVDIQKFEVNCSDPLREHCPFLAPPVTNIDDITARQLETKHVTKDMLPSASCHQGHSWFSINRSAGPGPSHSSGSCTLKHIATSHKYQSKPLVWTLTFWRIDLNIYNCNETKICAQKYGRHYCLDYDTLYIFIWKDDSMYAIENKV